VTDYTKLIDAETWAFIERINSFYPPETIDFTIDEQRAVYNRMCRAFFAGYPDGVEATDEAIAAGSRSIPIRRYRKDNAPGKALLLYFHGGGFILGDLDSHDDVCAELCDQTGFAVISVDYRLAPEHRHPAAFDDALAAYEWAARTHEGPILLAGDSAGGNLAAAISHAIRGRTVQAAGQVLIYPGLGGDMTKGSYLEHAEAPMLTTRDVAFYKSVRDARADDPTASPLADTDFYGLPPTVIVTAQCDPLSSDGEAYRDRIRAAGGQAFWIEEKGMVHGYLRARHSVGGARASFGRIVAALRALGTGRVPFAEMTDAEG
jgi:acetyl esterase